MVPCPFVVGNAIALDIDVFRVTSWRGDVVECGISCILRRPCIWLTAPLFLARVDDIRPRWFAAPVGKSSSKLPVVPFDQMFADNELWLPLLTSGKYFIGRIDFASPSPGEDVGPILRYWFATV